MCNEYRSIFSDKSLEAVAQCAGRWLRTPEVQMNLEAKVENAFDPMTALMRGIVSTPALLVNGKVTISGRVPELEEINRVLKK